MMSFVGTFDEWIKVVAESGRMQRLQAWNYINEWQDMMHEKTRTLDARVEGDFVEIIYREDDECATDVYRGTFSMADIYSDEKFMYLREEGDGYVLPFGFVAPFFFGNHKDMDRYQKYAPPARESVEKAAE